MPCLMRKFWNACNVHHTKKLRIFVKHVVQKYNMQIGFVHLAESQSYIKEAQHKCMKKRNLSIWNHTVSVLISWKKHEFVQNADVQQTPPEIIVRYAVISCKTILYTIGIKECIAVVLHVIPYWPVTLYIALIAVWKSNNTILFVWIIATKHGFLIFLLSLSMKMCYYW